MGDFIYVVWTVWVVYVFGNLYSWSEPGLGGISEDPECFPGVKVAIATMIAGVLQVVDIHMK